MSTNVFQHHVVCLKKTQWVGKKLYWCHPGCWRSLRAQSVESRPNFCTSCRSNAVFVCVRRQAELEERQSPSTHNLLLSVLQFCLFSWSDLLLPLCFLGNRSLLLTFARAELTESSSCLVLSRLVSYFSRIARSFSISLLVTPPFFKLNVWTFVPVFFPFIIIVNHTFNSLGYGFYLPSLKHFSAPISHPPPKNSIKSLEVNNMILTLWVYRRIGLGCGLFFNFFQQTGSGFSLYVFKKNWATVSHFIQCGPLLSLS